VALAVLDASVLIAFRDPADALHTRAIAAFRAHSADELVLPASAYAEVLVGPLRYGSPAVASLEEFIGDFGMQIIPLTAQIARRAAALQANTPSVRLPDAFVLATAELLDAPIVLTGDTHWPKLSPRARVI
jgi:predicted nucleic acid-binding protein